MRRRGGDSSVGSSRDGRRSSVCFQKARCARAAGVISHCCSRRASSEAWVETWGKCWLSLLNAGAIQLGQLAKQNACRPTIRDDVVLHQQQDVIVSVKNKNFGAK